MRPWLCEVNSLPSLGIGGPEDLEVGGLNKGGGRDDWLGCWDGRGGRNAFHVKVVDTFDIIWVGVFKVDVTLILIDFGGLCIYYTHNIFIIFLFGIIWHCGF